MSATKQPETAIVVEGWTWGLDEEHSRQAAILCTDPLQLIKMADELMGKQITDNGELIRLLVINVALPFDKANQLAKFEQQSGLLPFLLCRREDATPEALETWSEAGDPNSIKSIADNPNTKLQTLEKLASHPNPSVVSDVLLSGRLPQETIDSFASRNEVEIKIAVAAKTQNPETIRAVAKNADLPLAALICLNPYTPTDVINEIGRKYLEVIIPYAYRVTDPAVLRALCGEYGKKYEVYLTYKSIPADAELKKHWPLVVNGHCWGLNEPESLAAAAEVKDKEHILRMANDLSSLRLDIDKYPTLGTQILEYLIGNEALPIEDARHILRLTPDLGCRYKLLGRRDLTLEIVDEFEPCLDERIRLAFQTNNIALLDWLASDPESDVRLGVVHNPITKMHTLEKAATTDNNIEVVIEATKRLTNPDVLKAVYDQSGKWPASTQVRELHDALVANPHTSELVRVVIQI